MRVAGSKNLSRRLFICDGVLWMARAGGRKCFGSICRVLVYRPEDANNIPIPSSRWKLISGSFHGAFCFVSRELGLPVRVDIFYASLKIAALMGMICRFVVFAPRRVGIVGKCATTWVLHRRSSFPVSWKRSGAEEPSFSILDLESSSRVQKESISGGVQEMMKDHSTYPWIDPKTLVSTWSFCDVVSFESSGCFVSLLLGFDQRLERNPRNKWVIREILGDCRRKKAGRCGTDPQTTPIAASTTLWWIALTFDRTSYNDALYRPKIAGQTGISYAKPEAGGKFQVISLSRYSCTR